MSEEFYRFRGENFVISTDDNPVYYALLSYRWDHHSNYGRGLYKGYFKKGTWETHVVIVEPKSINKRWPNGLPISNFDTPSFLG